MDPFVKDFNAFLSRISGSSSCTLGTSTKGDRPPVVPSTKGKLPISSFGGSQGTLATHKRKLGSLFAVSGDLIERELDLVANKRICHLTDCFLHSSECISLDMAIEANIWDLSDRYSQRSRLVMTLVPHFFFFSCSFFMCVIHFSLLYYYYFFFV